MISRRPNPDSQGDSPMQPMVLLIEPDRQAAASTMQALQSCCLTGGMLHERVQAAQCVTVRSLRETHALDLRPFDLVLCAMDLYDASGIDVLAYLRGAAPHLPVILTSSHVDTALAVEAVRAGALDFVVRTDDYLRVLPLVVEKCLAHQRVKHENERLHRALNRSLCDLADKNMQLEAVIGQLEAMARTDELTGLANRRWFNESISRHWAEALRHGRPLAFLMIDLDNFKRLNDSLGHQQGDELLRVTARVLQANCREVDVTSRYGGDEFCVLMPQTRLSDAIRAAERIRVAFRLAVAPLREEGFDLSMSIGLAHIEHSRPASAEMLIRHADEAMYAAKMTPGSAIMLRHTEGTTPVDVDAFFDERERQSLKAQPHQTA